MCVCAYVCVYASMCFLTMLNAKADGDDDDYYNDDD